jgi:hypothetical protein
MQKKNLILFVLILLKFVLQYSLISSEYELHRDEFLHLDQGKHLAWGFISVPPVSSWFAYLILQLGNSVFWVKFFPALLGALTMLVIWKIIEELKGNLFALILGTIAILFSVILRLNILFQPNSFDVLIWTTIILVIVKYANSEQNKWLYILGILFAIGFLNKYNVVFLLLGLLPAIIFSEHRKIFTNKHLYFALLLSFILVSPNLIWQYQNGFPVFYHINELKETQLVNVNRLDFVKEQLLFFIGSVYVLIASLIAFWTYKPFQKFRFLFWTFFGTLALFIYLKAKGYYAIGLYPAYFAFGAVYIEYLLQDSWKKYLKPVAIVVPIIVFIPIVNIIFPNMSPAEIQLQSKKFKDLGLLRWEDGKEHTMPQDFADMLGWKELADKVALAYESLATDSNSQTIIWCDNYGQAGAINFYLHDKNIQAYSLNADYIDWIPLDKKIQHVILVQDQTDDDPERKREASLFESVAFFGEITNPYSREQHTKIYVLKNATADINRIIKEEIEETKKSQQ